MTCPDQQLGSGKAGWLVCAASQLCASLPAGEDGALSGAQGLALVYTANRVWRFDLTASLSCSRLRLSAFPKLPVSPLVLHGPPCAPWPLGVLRVLGVLDPTPRPLLHRMQKNHLGK